MDRKKIEVEQMRNEEQHADTSTKALPREAFVVHHNFVLDNRVHNFRLLKDVVLRGNRPREGVDDKSATRTISLGLYCAVDRRNCSFGGSRLS